MRASRIRVERQLYGDGAAVTKDGGGAAVTKDGGTAIVKRHKKAVPAECHTAGAGADKAQTPEKRELNKVLKESLLLKKEYTKVTTDAHNSHYAAQPDPQYLLKQGEYAVGA